MEKIITKHHLVEEIVRCLCGSPISLCTGEGWNSVVSFAQINKNLWNMIMVSKEFESIREKLYFETIEDAASIMACYNSINKCIVHAQKQGGWSNNFKEHSPRSVNFNRLYSKEISKREYKHTFTLRYQNHYDPISLILRAIYLPKNFNKISISIGNESNKVNSLEKSQVKVLQKFYEIDENLVPFGIFQNSGMISLYFNSIYIDVYTNEPNLELWGVIDDEYGQEKFLETFFQESCIIKRIESGKVNLPWYHSLHLFIRGGKIKSCNLFGDYNLNSPVSIEKWCDDWTWVKLHRHKCSSKLNNLSKYFFEHIEVEKNEKNKDFEIFVIVPNIFNVTKNRCTGGIVMCDPF